MPLHPFNFPQAQVHDAFTLDVPPDLVFDDEPLEPMLCGGQALAPTPANVVEIWRQRRDRSPACTRALAAVLLKTPEALDQIVSIEDAAECLMAALESQPANQFAGRAACLAGMARILQLTDHPAEAETLYRRVLDLLQRASHGTRTR